MTEFLAPTAADYLDKDALKAALPMEYVLVHYGRALNNDGRALCPWHNDHDPSLNLWRGDDGVIRWSCFPCGKHGDVFDFIQDIEGLTFPQSLNRAREIYNEMPETFTSQVVFEEPPPPPDLDEIVTAARARVAGNGWLAISTKMIEQPQDDEEWMAAQQLEQWLRQNWRWGLLDNGTDVLMPHYDADGVATGAKVRSADGRRWSIRGSQYMRALYGAWRHRRYRDVLLCEGETDTAWAAWQAHQKNLPLHVLGLPSGAGAEPNAAWASALDGAQKIYLCFDADAAGSAALEKWLTYLTTVRNHQNLYVCLLPMGLDLRDARPDLQTMLNHAIRPNLFTHIIEAGQDGFPSYVKEGYARRRSAEDEEAQVICKARLKPVAALQPGDPEDTSITPAFDVEVFSTRDMPEYARLSTDDLLTKKNFQQWLNKHSQESFLGSEQDVVFLRDHLYAKTKRVPEKYQTPRVGLHNAPPSYSYLGRSLAYSGHADAPRVGKLPWVVVRTPTFADATERLSLEDGPADLRWAGYVLAMNDPRITHPLMAWMAAASRRTEVRDFPLLFMGGSSGAGKSTLARVACELFGSRIVLQLGQLTNFGLLSWLSSTTTIPVFVDEWTRVGRQDAREAMQGSIPQLYEGSTAYRGTASLNLIPYRLTAPTVVAGEDAFDLTRELERTVVLELRRDEQNFAALRELQGEPLGRFALHFYRWLVHQPLDRLPQFQHTAPDRPTYNREILRTGWQTLQLFFEDQSDYYETPHMPDEPVLTALEEQRAEQEDPYERALIAGFNMRDGRAGLPLAWADPQGRGTWVRFTELVSAVAAHQRDIALPGGSRAMKNFFIGRGYNAEEGRPKTMGETVRATLLHGLHIDAPSATDRIQV